MAQLVEHVIGNDEVISSTLIASSKKPDSIESGFLFCTQGFTFSFMRAIISTER